MSLTGLETLQVLGRDALGQPAAVTQTTTTAAIAALAAIDSQPIVNTAITTVGDGVLTAAGLVGGLITRTGPVAAYTDTTATAAAIVAALPGLVVGSTFLVRIKNATAFTQTLAAGVGVTLPLTVILAPYSTYNSYATVTSATAVTFTHFNQVPVANSIASTVPAVTALATNGAGTITAASIASGFVSRTTVAAAFTDTTDTAANIIAACPELVNKIGTAMLFRYTNNATAAATIAGGTGVTVSGITSVNAGMSATYLITYTAAATLTMVGLFQALAVVNSGTFVNNGTSTVTTSNAAVTANSNIIITLKTVGGTVGAIPHLLTITPGTGFATVGTASDTSTYSYLIIG